MHKIHIALTIEVDSALSIAEMREIVIQDVRDWLATAPVMAQLSEAEDVLKVAHG